MENNNQKQVQGMSEASFAGLMNFIFLFPSVGWIISIVLWAIGKSESEYVDKWGKELLNWFISCILYAIALGLASIIFILLSPIAGSILIFILFGALAVFMLICPIIAGVKALNHETWTYPLAIKLIK